VLLEQKKPELYTNGFFGQTYKYELNDGWYLILTNWRRISMNKITFMKDIFTSVLSSTMNSAMSHPYSESFLKEEKI